MLSAVARAQAGRDPQGGTAMEALSKFYSKNDLFLLLVVVFTMSCGKEYGKMWMVI